jgi:hypothetical protein
MPYVLPPAKPPTPPKGNGLTTRHIALLYLPTVGIWSLVQAIRFYRRHGRLIDRT